MHMYISLDKRVQRSITCTSRNVNVYMTHPISKWLPWSNPPLRHRYGRHEVTPYPYVIAIYRTCIYCRPDIATWRSRDHDLFI